MFIETEGNAFFLTDILGVVINIDDVTQITTRATNRQVCEMIPLSCLLFVTFLISVQPQKLSVFHLKQALDRVSLHLMF